MTHGNANIEARKLSKPSVEDHVSAAFFIMRKRKWPQRETHTLRERGRTRHCSPTNPASTYSSPRAKSPMESAAAASKQDVRLGAMLFPSFTDQAREAIVCFLSPLLTFNRCFWLNTSSTYERQLPKPVNTFFHLLFVVNRLQLGRGRL